MYLRKGHLIQLWIIVIIIRKHVDVFIKVIVTSKRTIKEKHSVTKGKEIRNVPYKQNLQETWRVLSSRVF